MNDWKERLGTVYSTKDDFQYQTNSDNENIETLPPEKQKLRVALDKRNRKGKQVTIVADFVGNETQLATLAKTIKTKCGVGGSSKDGEIIIQGDLRDKIVAILITLGYKARKI